jgi:two-component system sensor histidine kinase GlrK
MNLYPRSLLRLVLVSWLLTALPLLAAIAYAYVSLTQLTSHSDETMEQISEATRLSWELGEDLDQMERILRQYQVLHDPSLLGDYAAYRREWLENGTRFVKVPLVRPLAGRIGTMVEQESAAYALLQGPGANPKPLHEALGTIRGHTVTLIEEVRRVTAAEREAFRTETETLQRHFLVAMLAAFLLALVLFWGGRYIIARLLSRFERAIAILGEHRLDRRIQLKGPEDMQRIGERLDWLRRRMRTLEEQRTRILRHVSHELKTPLAALREGASLLHEGVAGALTPQQAKIAGIMQNNVLRLQGLIDSLLKMQQAGHAREKLEMAPLRFDQLIQGNLETHMLAARNKRLRVSGTLAPLTVEGGREALTTVVNNLISNAIKFSPDGGSVRVLLAREGDCAVLDVIDDGPGIPPEDHDKIFEPFYRSAHTKSVAGVGLGLAIAREFAAAHHGALELMPAANGTHFRAVLPLAKAAA